MSETIEPKWYFDQDDENKKEERKEEANPQEVPKADDYEEDLTEEAKSVLENYRLNRVKSYRDIDENLLINEKFYNELIHLVEDRIKSQFDEKFSGLNDDRQKELKKKLQEKLNRAGDAITDWRNSVLGQKPSGEVNEDFINVR